MTALHTIRRCWMRRCPPRRSAAAPRSRPPRRGVLLLVVLSMLTLFLLLGMTYLILASRTRATSKAFLQLADDQARTTSSLKPYLKQAALQVIRGTGNPRSVLKYHDLLADKYGGDGTTYQVNPSRPTFSNGRLIRLELPGTNDGPGLCGRVATFIDGPDGVRNTSVRIVHAQNGDSGSWIYILKPSLLTAASSLSEILINRQDFSGTGFSPAPSFNGQGITSLNDSAFLPNRVFDTGWSTLASDPAHADEFGGSGNEDYDAIDEQNWALSSADGSIRSFERQDVIALWLRDHAFRTTASGDTPKTRPAVNAEVLRALQKAPSGSVSVEEARTILRLRRATLRPFAFDHFQDDAKTIDFTGKSLSSSGIDVLTNCSGDVDTDGDGTLDSVWLDLGYASMLTSDRKYVKPLFAIHCVDLGGRVNLNVHGSPLDAVDPRPSIGPELAVKRGDDGSITRATSLTTGLGFGPADVRLDAVISQQDAAAVMLGSSSMTGNGDGMRRDLGGIVGRYGDGVGGPDSLPRPGTPDTNDRGDGPLPGVPNDYWTEKGSKPSLFGGSPPDFWGRLAVGIDHRGHPFFVKRAPGLSLQEGTDNPYELDLFAPKMANGYDQGSNSAQRWFDQPFTAAELEAILRPFDFDNASALPPRALAMALSGTGGSLTQNRLLVTTESWDTPALIGPNIFGNVNLYDADLASGLKMDLNRPFGDGFDSDGNGVVDDTGIAGESGDPYTAAFELLIRAAAYPDLFIKQKQPGPDSPQLRARQLLAFHLYNLVAALRDRFMRPSTGDPGMRLFKVIADDGDATTPPQAADPSLSTVTAQAAHNNRVLAQWAVNVVDFLDADAVMTAFRYLEPTNLVADPTQYVVWGCEHPDLLVTETLACHDRRTADTKCDLTGETTAEFRSQYESVYDAYINDPLKKKPRPNVNDPDLDPADADDFDFDQVRIPEGSLFLELYATRDPNTPNLPRELYTYNASSGWTLDVGKMAPAGPQGAAPVWRLAVSANTSAISSNDVFRELAKNPDTAWLSPGTNPSQIADKILIDRYIWLTATKPAASGAGPTINNTFYLRDGAPSPALKPGGYLVIGPRQTTYLGSMADNGEQKWGVPSTQSIKLGGAVPVAVTGLDGSFNPTVTAPRDKAFGDPLPPPNWQETVATWVACDPPASGAWPSMAGKKGVPKGGIGLNVSEPLRDDYYPCPTEVNPATGVFDAYGPLDDDTHTSFLGLPLDRSGGPLTKELLSGGSFANFCTVFVERLADPTRPYEPDASKPAWNPYIAVDFMPVDLTVFNGESADRDPRETQGQDRGGLGEIPLVDAGGQPLEPSKVPLPVASSAQLAARQTYFHTRQRGFGADLPRYDNNGTLFGISDSGAPATVYRNPHPFKPIGSLDDILPIPRLAAAASATSLLPGGTPTVPRPASASTAFFRHELGQSPQGRQTTPATWTGIPFQSLGWVNPSFGRRLGLSDVPASYVGSPDRPFPWIVWNDRPFANPYELVYVPRTPPGRLFTNYRNLDYPSIDRGTTALADYKSRSTPDTTAPYNGSDIFGACTPGAHLMPLTSITDVPLTDAVGSRHADLFARLFEYVRVRSPFTGTDTVLPDPVNDADRPPERFWGPFNRVATYREPGKINVNTIPPEAGAPVWNAICGAVASPPAPDFAKVLGSQKIGLSFPAPTSATGTYRRPFRTMSAAYDRTDFAASTVPGAEANTFFPQRWLNNPTFSGGTWYPLTKTDPPQDVVPAIGDSFTARSFTLLGDDLPTQPGKSRLPLFGTPASASWAADGQRNAWFRLETLVRANANTTVRSEVYAIWVTMGLFEVVNSPAYSWPVLTNANGAVTVAPRAFVSGEPSPAYPDGKRLVREYGSDTGDVTRHRSFFIYDRSVPVGYRTAEDMNVSDGILVERFIE